MKGVEILLPGVEVQVGSWGAADSQGGKEVVALEYRPPPPLKYLGK